ncbi:hypothetical protein SOV_22430 [Sporomusa ovata DSM 2662]|uniref:hypothetical protein n=1 Tax=Sporomusa ovata TaxID=2378 RepID=UPI0003884791|nr:hypothetical protein [Sporomusa ovata]EQB25559.1 hypothetical protein SOV_4c02220 [Sporomusa ovata DSM 2662]
MKKRLVTVLAISLFLILSSVTCFAEDRYQILASTKQSTYYLDTQTIKFARNTITNQLNTDIVDFWEKVIYSEDGIRFVIEFRTKKRLPLKGYENFNHALYHYRINLRANQILTLRAIDYDSNGQILAEYQHDSSWHDTIPDSLGEYKLKCIKDFVTNNYDIIYGRS